MDYAILTIFVFTIAAAIVVGSCRGGYLYGKEAAGKQQTTVEQVNLLLEKEGYKIYFRINEHGQVALVHPR